MTIAHSKACLSVLLGGILLMLSSACQADRAFQVTVNTASLTNLAGPFSVDFQLTDGSGANDGNNQITIDSFVFGGGQAAGSAILTGGATGDLASQIHLRDSQFLNDFRQAFIPGSQLIFNVSLTNNLDNGITPDLFSFALLQNGFEIPTVGLGDALVLTQLGGNNPPVISFDTDASRTSIGIPAPTISSVSVPEPHSITLASVTGICSYICLRRRRQVTKR